MLKSQRACAKFQQPTSFLILSCQWLIYHATTFHQNLSVYSWFHVNRLIPNPFHNHTKIQAEQNVFGSDLDSPNASSQPLFSIIDHAAAILWFSASNLLSCRGFRQSLWIKPSYGVSSHPILATHCISFAFQNLDKL